VQVCAKFGGDWSNGLHVKWEHRYKHSLLYMYIDWVWGLRNEGLTKAKNTKNPNGAFFKKR